MNRKIVISIIWLVFAILFFSLAFCHRAELKKTMPKIKVRKYPSDDTTTIARGGVSVEQRLIDFGDDFNKYLDDQDESNRKANLYAYGGYLVAGLTALFAMALEWQEYIRSFMAKNGFTGEKPKDEQKQ